ncbi:MAG: hypothetical protein KGD70_07105 [Candidatus Lokiarchaeota archaeon]|nr:hypothetical protein [Candidatus Lokiarchaeota archaeon]
MAKKLNLSPFTLYFIVIVITVYAIWFIFFQEVIQFILENAISTFGGAHRSPVNGWIGIFLLPFLVVIVIMGITLLIPFLRAKIKGKKKFQRS